MRPALVVLAAIALLVTLVPGAVTGAAAATGRACTATTGPAQKKVERFLHLRVDGVNSRADCKVIRKFQRRNGIVPAEGYAGPTTKGLVKRLRLSADRADRCDVRRMVVCVDLTSQTAWISERGVTTWGPFAVRSGRDGYETRTGRFRVQSKDIDHVSSIYGSPMPFAMFFSGGQAFHTSDRYLYDPLGSHGCVHIVPKVAQAMWDRVSTGTAVHVFGRKPGT